MPGFYIDKTVPLSYLQHFLNTIPVFMKKVFYVSMLIFALVLFGCTDGGNDAGDAATDGTLTVHLYRKWYLQW
jgi:hypothetical protein